MYNTTTEDKKTKLGNKIVLSPRLREVGRGISDRLTHVIVKVAPDGLEVLELADVARHVVMP